MKRSYLLGGVFLFLKDRWRLPNVGFLLNALFGWLVGAVFLLLVTTLIANTAVIGEFWLGYMSSAISFFAAVTAGISAARRLSAARLPAALIAATALVIALLTIGFLIRGEGMNSSAILSIVSFTYTGVITGMFIHPKKKRHGIKYQISKLT
jgi:hypothetical protein